MILFDPSDDANAAPINLLADVKPEWRPFVAASMVDTLKSLWGYDTLATPVLDQYLYNAIAALIEMPGATLIDIHFMLTSNKFRNQALEHVTDPAILSFWQKEFGAMNERERRETARSTLNKIGAFTADPRMRGVVGYPKSVIRLEEVMENNESLLIFSQFKEICSSLNEFTAVMLST